MPNASVAGKQPDLVIAKCLAGCRAPQHLVEDFRRLVKSPHRLADERAGAVAQQIELRLVGADDDSVGVNPVNTDRPVLEEVMAIACVRRNGTKIDCRLRRAHTVRPQVLGLEVRSTLARAVAVGRAIDQSSWSFTSGTT